MIKDLRHRIKLYRIQREPDQTGGARLSWLLSAETWARVTLLTPDLAQDHDQIGSRLRARIGIRSPSDVATGWRIFWEGHWFDVISVIPPGIPDERILIDGQEVRP